MSNLENPLPSGNSPSFEPIEVTPRTSGPPPTGKTGGETTTSNAGVTEAEVETVSANVAGTVDTKDSIKTVGDASSTRIAIFTALSDGPELPPGDSVAGKEFLAQIAHKATGGSGGPADNPYMDASTIAIIAVILYEIFKIESEAKEILSEAEIGIMQGKLEMALKEAEATRDIGKLEAAKAALQAFSALTGIIANLGGLVALGFIKDKKPNKQNNQKTELNSNGPKPQTKPVNTPPPGLQKTPTTPAGGTGSSHQVGTAPITPGKTPAPNRAPPSPPESQGGSAAAKEGTTTGSASGQKAVNEKRAQNQADKQTKKDNDGVDESIARDLSGDPNHQKALMKINFSVQLVTQVGQFVDASGRAVLEPMLADLRATQGLLQQANQSLTTSEQKMTEASRGSDEATKALADLISRLASDQSRRFSGNA